MIRSPSSWHGLPASGGPFQDGPLPSSLAATQPRRGSEPMCTGHDVPSMPPTSSRRSFLFKLGLGLNVIAATLVGIPVVGYLLGPVRRRAEQAWIKLGPLTGFPIGETRLATYENPFRVAWDGATANIPCWVRRIEGERFQVFAINCAHLGCPVRWFAESRLFMCPCHGGVYYED